jgi:rubrerythrin
MNPDELQELKEELASLKIKHRDAFAKWYQSAKEPDVREYCFQGWLITQAMSAIQHETSPAQR